MKIAIVASEATPFSKTGGLADVAGALFKEYLRTGVRTDLFVPMHRETKARFGALAQDSGAGIEIPLGKTRKECSIYTLGSDVLFERDRPDASGTVYLIGNDEFFDREELYDAGGTPYPDNDQRFIFFCRAVIECCRHFGLSHDILHCNDWQSALIPMYIRTVYKDDPLLQRSRTVFTIHNLAFQGVFSPYCMGAAGLGWEYFTPDGLEYYGRVNFLKAGIIWADRITTVSATYALEILTPELGFGLDGLLRKRRTVLTGILNGIDCEEWDPAADRLIPHNYSSTDLTGKAICKREVIRKTGLKGPADAPLVCFVGRLSVQKGIDLLIGSMPELIGLGARVIIVGKGDEPLQEGLGSLRSRFPGALSLHLGFDEDLARNVYAASDIFLMPSHYEPCGLGQMIAMRYGTVPVARKTGGLADTIEAAGDSLEQIFCSSYFGESNATGFLFGPYDQAAFMREIKRALCVFSNRKAWQGLMRNALSRDFSWRRSAQQYIDLYRETET